MNIEGVRSSVTVCNESTASRYKQVCAVPSNSEFHFKGELNSGTRKEFRLLNRLDIILCYFATISSSLDRLNIVISTTFESDSASTSNKESRSRVRVMNGRRLELCLPCKQGNPIFCLCSKFVGQILVCAMKREGQSCVCARKSQTEMCRLLKSYAPKNTSNRLYKISLH